MTGFGNASYKKQDKTCLVEIRSVNSKQFDFSIKLPSELREMENDIRKLISNLLERGKIECVITIEEDGCSVNNYTVNPIALKNILKN